MVALLQVLYFAVPVIYFAEQVRQPLLRMDPSGTLYHIYMLNPLVTIITAFRAWMLEPISVATRDLSFSTSDTVNPGYLLFTIVASLIIAVSGYALFNRMKWSFVERP
jgi:ABC-2 type transport system permease protein